MAGLHHSSNDIEELAINKKHDVLQRLDIWAENQAPFVVSYMRDKATTLADPIQKAKGIDPAHDSHLILCAARKKITCIATATHTSGYYQTADLEDSITSLNGNGDIVFGKSSSFHYLNMDSILCCLVTKYRLKKNDIDAIAAAANAYQIQSTYFYSWLIHPTEH